MVEPCGNNSFVLTSSLEHPAGLCFPAFFHFLQVEISQGSRKYIIDYLQT